MHLLAGKIVSRTAVADRPFLLPEGGKTLAVQAKAKIIVTVTGFSELI